MLATKPTIQYYPATPWVRDVRLRPNAEARLFCFPHAGSGASVFFAWKDLLPGFIDFCPIQLPGREDRIIHDPFSDIPSLIDALLPELAPFLDVPFAFFGHSLGALIGFELARVLRSHGEPSPCHLFVSGHRAPHLPDPEPPVFDLPDPEFIAELKKLNGLSPLVAENDELMELVLPTIRADFRLNETYEYQPGEALPTPITACGGIQDQHVAYADLHAWGEHTIGTFAVRMFPGDHFYLLKDHVLLVRTIAQELQKYRNRS